MGDRAEFMRKRAIVGPGGQTNHAPDRIERLSIVAQKAQALRRLREDVLSRGMNAKRRAAVVAMFPELSGVGKKAIIAKTVELIDRGIAAIKTAERTRRKRKGEAMRRAATGTIVSCDLCSMEERVAEGEKVNRWLAIRLNTCGPGRCENVVRDICPSCVAKVLYHAREVCGGVIDYGLLNREDRSNA